MGFVVHVGRKEAGCFPQLLLTLIALSLLVTVHGEQVRATFATVSPHNEGAFSDGVFFHSSSRADMLAGTLSVATILVNFPDKTNVKTRSEINTLIFTDVNEYWKEVSYGKISLKGTTTSKWYTVQCTAAYYGEDPETTAKRLGFIREAVAAADDELNFKDYGYIVIVHAGDDQAKTGKASDLWSFGSIGTFNVETRDGTFAMGVSVVSEIDPVGPVAHEMGHNFGLLDLWDYKYDFSGGYPNGGEPFVGEWDLMGHGLWAGNGNNPTHLSSYSKIKLGWIPDAQIQSVGIDDNNKEVTLQPLVSGKGYLTTKIMLTRTTYYLVEVRKKIGRDSHIPMEGVIVYYVDETKGNGEGPLRVRSKTPPYPDTGAWQTGDTYFHPETGFKVAVGGTTGGGYRTAFGTAAQPPVTTFTITIQAQYNGLTVTFDGKSYTTDSSGTVRIQNVTAGQYKVSVQSSVAVSTGTRRGFIRWEDGSTANPRTLTVTSNVVLTATYRTEHRLNVVSKYGNITGAGWYENNATATVVLSGTVVDHNNGTRRAFTGWSGDLSGTDTTKKIVMTAPKDATANWATEYQLKVTSSYGNPQGPGWYRAGTSASFSITSPFPVGDATRYIFIGWSGDSTGTNTQGTISMDRPRTIIATWKAQYVVTLQFQDAKGTVLQTPPSKVMLASPNATALPLTSSPGYTGLWLDEGTWTLKQVIWHGVDVKKAEASYNPKPRDTWRIQLRVYSLTVKVTSSLTGWAVAGAKVSITLPDAVELSNSTDNQGSAVFAQLPAYESYSIVVSAQGMVTKVNMKLSETATKPIVASLWLLTDILMIVALVGAIAVVGIIVRRKRGAGEAAIHPSLHQFLEEKGSEKIAHSEPIAKLLDDGKTDEEKGSLEEWMRSELKEKT